MKTKTCVVMAVLLFTLGLANAAYTSPGWSYGYELGVAKGDNAGGEDYIVPMGRAHLQLEIFKFMFLRVGLGYTQLYAKDAYATKTMFGDARLIVRPYQNDKFAPFIYAGDGASKEMRFSDADLIPHFPMGVGFQTKLKQGMLLEVAGGYNLTNSDMLDSRLRAEDDLNTFTNKKQDGFYSLTVGLSFYNPGPQPKKAKAVTYVAPTPAPAPAPTPPPAPVFTTPPAPKEIPVVKVDPYTLDSDGDGLSDGDEMNKYNSNPKNADTDGDGLNDYVEVMQHKTDPLKADTDGDGLNDYAEVMQHKTNPLNPDTDGDGLNDYVEVMQYKTDPLKADTDGEGLNDYAEVMQHKTDPLKADTDGDGLNDYAELMQYKTDPLDKDTDKGTIADGAEVQAGTDPLNPKDDVMELKKGTTFSLEGILFETGKATIVPASTEILEKAYIALSANPDVKIIIIGHTDNVGSAASNQTLSERRAASVKNWLVAKGMDANRIKTMGKGPSEPRATNDTAAGRTLNRRIEFQIEN